MAIGSRDFRSPSRFALLQPVLQTLKPDERHSLMRRGHFYIWLFVVMLYLSSDLYSQSPSLFMSEEDFAARQQVAEREPWAKASLAALIKEADDFPRSYNQRFGLTDAAPPPE